MPRPYSSKFFLGTSEVKLRNFLLYEICVPGNLPPFCFYQWFNLLLILHIIILLLCYTSHLLHKHQQVFVFYMFFLHLPLEQPITLKFPLFKCCHVSRGQSTHIREQVLSGALSWLISFSPLPAAAPLAYCSPPAVALLPVAIAQGHCYVFSQYCCHF